MSDIPVPVIRNDRPVPRSERTGQPGRPRSSKWAFLRELEVDQCAEFEFASYEDLVSFRTLLNSNASRIAKKENMGFSVRTGEEQDKVTVWRIK